MMTDAETTKMVFMVKVLPEAAKRITAKNPDPRIRRGTAATTRRPLDLVTDARLPFPVIDGAGLLITSCPAAAPRATTPTIKRSPLASRFTKLKFRMNAPSARKSKEMGESPAKTLVTSQTKNASLEPALEAVVSVKWAVGKAGVSVP
jgi:hypothetical protein